ncbi:hypothetical protein P154DRAFT_617684 [Amniculicola lignicola CBS 123094]|uniref:Diphthamide biosynthesis protein 4 n=1 Tax=Amniculicola lignicola CBS 123094 TaxID=1392246 RepID=A0A6A5X0J5_9PLEO|nr:hypothetical protein P154DRAFT_617684 [Amniculicola lignicola CBS 123094]
MVIERLNCLPTWFSLNQHLPNHAPTNHQGHTRNIPTSLPTYLPRDHDHIAKTPHPPIHPHRVTQSAVQRTKMTYTKNYYTVLGLETGAFGTGGKMDGRMYTQGEIRSMYKKALFRAHPDRLGGRGREAGGADADGQAQAQGPVRDWQTQTQAQMYTRGEMGEMTEENRCTVDDVKEAYMVLGDEKRRREYDVWVEEGGWKVLSSYSHDNSYEGGDNAGMGMGMSWTQDFILGLEVLDLEDFKTNGEEEGTEAEGMVWTRPCRCGAEGGFRIEEEELERASGRGEKEVLVGCGGCSLWVRVGFEVEVEEG